MGVEEGDAPCAESEEAGLRGEGGEEGGAEEGPPRVHQEWDVTLSVVAAVCTIVWCVPAEPVVTTIGSVPLVDAVCMCTQIGSNSLPHSLPWPMAFCHPKVSMSPFSVMRTLCCEPAITRTTRICGVS